MSRLSPRIMAIAVLLFLVLGCATVHQPVGLDRTKTTTYSVNNTDEYKTDESKTLFYFDLPLESAVETILETCFRLEVPIYHPLGDSSGNRVRITSGSFIAQVGIDCEMRGTNWAWGHGSELANGILQIEIERSDAKTSSVQIETSFYRTESTGGEYGSTQNIYLDSTGRIEKEILGSLSRQERTEYGR